MWKQIQRNESDNSDHRERNTLQKIYCSDIYNNDIWSREIKSAAENQQQQHTPDKINGGCSTITNNIQAISLMVEQWTISKQKNRKKRHKPMINKTAPSHNTGSRTQKTETPLARSTISCTRWTRTENKKQKGQASKLETTISQLENKVHQYLVVMDTETGKILNYRQLIRKIKYKKNWSTLSANELGRLSNEVNGRIKTWLTQSHSSEESTSRTIKGKTWYTENSYEVYDQRKKKRTKQYSQLADT